MPYAQQSDIAAKWGDQFALAATDSGGNSIDASRVATALSAASALIDGYLVQRYNLPVNATPDGATLLTKLCCDLAMGELAVDPGSRTEIVCKSVEEAHNFLKRVADGSTAIPEIPQPGVDPGPQEAVMVANTRELTMRNLRGL